MTNLSVLTACSPKVLIPHLIRSLKARRTPIVRSSPGMGKSDIARKIARDHNLKLIDIRLSQCDPTDLNGLPNFENGYAVYTPFVFFPVEGADPGINPETGKPYAGWMLLFDEITSAPKQIQAAAYKIILDRQIGMHDLDRRVVMMAAGNQENDNAVVHQMSTALKSRLVHYDMVVNKDDWIDWAIEHNIDTRITAFISFKPKLLHNFDPETTEHTFPCPRTWEFVHDHIKDYAEIGQDDFAPIAGCVGPGAANEFIEFCRIYTTLPKISAILANPAGVHIPSEPGIKYALSMMLVEHFDINNADDLLTFLDRLPVEARVICLRTLAQRNQTMLQHAGVAKRFGQFGRALAA